MQIYQVGGSVRDELLGLKVVDRDYVVVGATPEALLSKGFEQVGKDFPVFLHPDTKQEYALARTERKIGKGYHAFECDASASVTLEADLKRRDLTINAMAKKDTGKIIDPFGGQKDLEQKILRHVSEAFSEDPLRVLRVARFAARFAVLGFKIAEETKTLMRTIVENKEMEALVVERVWKECEKALSESTPSRFFETLRECGALAVLFPSIDKLWGIPQPEKWHPEIDTGVHVMSVLDQSAKLSADLKVRFSALCHDLGKGLTPQSEWPSHRGHEARGVKPLLALCEQYRIPKSYQELAVCVCRFHLLCHHVFELKPSRLLKLIEDLDGLRRPERLENFVLACMADFRGRKGYECVRYPQADYLRAALECVKSTPIQSLIEMGHQGAKLGALVRRARLRALSAFKAKNKAFD